MGLYDDIINAFNATEPADLTATQKATVDAVRAGGNLSASGDVLGALSHLQFGLQSQQAAEYQAAQLRQNAGQSQAMAERQAYNQDLDTRLLESRALAVAAASGGGASDPTVVNTIARIAGEGAYRKAAALYGGQDQARRQQMQAQAAEYHGAEERANSNLVGEAQFARAGGTMLANQARLGSLYAKYGAGGPGSAQPYDEEY